MQLITYFIRKNALSLGSDYASFKIPREHRIPKKPRIYGLDCSRYLDDLRSLKHLRLSQVAPGYLRLPQVSEVI